MSNALRASKQRAKECKEAGMEIFNRLEAQGIDVLQCGVGWDDDDSDYVAEIYIHTSEEERNHNLPKSNKGFQIFYEYVDDAQPA